MKLLRQTGDRYEFLFGQRERQVFCEVLRAFPVTPLEHHRVTRGENTPALTEAQQLLHESLTGFKQEARRRLEAFLAEPNRFTPHRDGLRASFDREEMEWLLQVLNDIRVGSWLQLGCPDPDAGQRPKLTPDNARYLPIMEAAGAFEYALLAALDGTDGAGWGPPREET
jgi:hypothetical protein